MSALRSLLRYPLFAAVGRRRLESWVAAGETLSVGLGETLLTTGAPGQWVFVILEGQVRVLRPGGGGRDLSLGLLGAGDVFGEYALLAPGLNTATCRAAGAGRVVRLPLAPLRDAVAAEPAVGTRLKRWLRLHPLLAYLRGSVFLGFVSSTSFLPLLDQCQTARFPAGHTIQADGLCDDRWFVVRRGTVRVRAEDEPEAAAAVLGPDDCFGEGALLGRSPLTRAEAVGDVECLALARDALLPADPGLSSVFQTRLSGKFASPAAAWVGQREAADCGVAALAMVARYAGMDVTLPALRARVAVGERGATLLELHRAAADLGFRSRAVRVSPDRLGQVALPAIAARTDGHYVVLFALTGENVLVGDPAEGVRAVSVAAFRKVWAGDLLLATVAPEAPPPAPDRPPGADADVFAEAGWADPPRPRSGGGFWTACATPTCGRSPRPARRPHQCGDCGA